IAHGFLDKCFKDLAGGRENGGDNDAPPTAVEDRLLRQAQSVAESEGGAGLDAAREMTRMLRQLGEGADGKRPAVGVLAKLRERSRGPRGNRDDPWRAAAAAPLVPALDREILADLPALGKRLADGDKAVADRREAASQLFLGLFALDRQPFRPQ